MGYVLDVKGFDRTLKRLSKDYRLYAPVRKTGEGRFTDVDVIRYDFITDASEIVLDKKSDYVFKELLTPLSETLFFFTEEEVKEADRDVSDVIVFLRSCDMHAVKRLDQMYLTNGLAKDPFYKRIRDHVHFALIACPESFDDCFCVDMKSNRTKDGYLFSVDVKGGRYYCDVKDAGVEKTFAANGKKSSDTAPRYVTKNEVRVKIPKEVPDSIYQSGMWEEYSNRCIACGRCNFACPTCTCYTMQDVFYTDNGRVGERRRVQASCMVDGYPDVAGGGTYRRKNGERMRFKVLHKVLHFRQRFGYDMCVGCGRCDAICPEYISFSGCINKLDKAVKEEMSHGK